MNRAYGQFWRCVRFAVAVGVIVAMVDSAPVAATPISPVTDGSQTIQIVTVPTVVGAVFSLDGTLITTGPDGTASLPSTAEGKDVRRLQLRSPGSGLASGKPEFVRLLNSEDKDGVVRAYALFKIFSDVAFTFRDSLGNSLPSARVTSLTIKSSLGESISLTGEALNRPISLLSQRAVAPSGVVRLKEIYYSVQEVVISGSNTVFRSQQKFFPSKTASFEVESSFHTLTIATSDSFFGFATGSNIIIRWPDQHLSKAPILNGRAVLPALPRGEYEMRIEGAGLTTWRPISVSRDQTVELQLISYFDVAVVLMLGLVVAAAGVVVGRRRFGSRHSTRRNETDSELATEVTDDGESVDEDFEILEDEHFRSRSEAVAQI